MMPCSNGPSSSDVVKRFVEITSYLKKLVQFQATDGDISFHFLHNAFFEEHIESILNKEIVKICLEIETIPLSDPFHLSKLINHIIMIDIENLMCLNTHLFSEAVQLGSIFTELIIYLFKD